MLQADQLRAVLAKITCPGWKVTLKTTPSSRYEVHCDMVPPPVNSHDPGQRLEWYGEHFVVKPSDEERDIVINAYTCMQFRLMHELAEQFRYEGMAVFDPHRTPSKIKAIRNLIRRNRILV